MLGTRLSLIKIVAVFPRSRRLTVYEGGGGGGGGVQQGGGNDMQMQRQQIPPYQSRLVLNLELSSIEANRLQLE